MQNKPDYQNGSLVNLMSSMSALCSHQLPYQPLKIFPALKTDYYDKIVHIIVDGLGYDYLAEYGTATFLYQHLAGKITSVFPTTTAAALTTFASGLAPGEHGITGWYMHLEGNHITKPAVILPFVERGSGISLLNYGLKPENIFPADRISIKQPGFRGVLPAEYQNSVYNNFILEKSANSYYKSIDEFFMQMTDLIKDNKKGYIYGYLPHFDDVFHHNGEKSTKLHELLNYLDKNIEKLISAKHNPKTLFVINSDHGLLDNSINQSLNLHNYPKIAETLSFPLCGESRMAYCFVKPEFKPDFKKIVNTELGGVCDVLSFQEAVDQQLFGLKQDHPYLAERTGDFLIMMHEGWVLKDFLDKEEIKFNPANHGGLSSKELFIPLIVI